MDRRSLRSFDVRAAARGTCCALALLCLSVAPAAHAQESASSAQDQAAAAAAYDRATAAYMSRQYERAGALFETAHRLAPAAAALTQAVRAHERAGNTLRAGSLALQLEALYPDDRAGQRAAQTALRAARSEFYRVDVACDACTVQVDGGLVSHNSFFVEPGTPHTIVAAFDTGEVSRTVEGAAGGSETVALEAPPAPVEPEEPPPEETDDPSGERGGPATSVQPPPADSGGVPLYVSLVGVGVTAALGGVLIWSGIDTLDGVPAYEENPTVDGLADGRNREERTNWLIAATAVAGAATAILFIFTDFGGGDEPPPAVEALLEVGPTGGVVGVRGRY